jgi:indolepyruvate ferredoxin oxidoreductase alpha subunit
MGDDTIVVNVEAIAKSLGIEKVLTVDPYDIKKTTAAIREVIEYDGPSVIISLRSCPLKAGRSKPLQVTEDCKACGVCIKTLGCPAISMGVKHAEIDSTLCSGCGVCEQVCSFKAIRSVA